MSIFPIFASVYLLGASVYMSTYERNANRLTTGLFIMLTGLSVAGAIWLPSPIPVHYNGNGQPDRWGSPTTLLILPLLCGFMIGLLWATRYTPTRLMNFPGPRTSKNIASQRQNIDQLMATIRILIAGLFLGITGQITWVSIHHLKQVTMWPSYLFIGSIFIVTMLYLIRAFRLVSRQ